MKPLEFKTFSQPMQEAITAYCGPRRKHLRLGCLCRNRPLGQSPCPGSGGDKKFATEVLKYKARGAGSYSG